MPPGDFAYKVLFKYMGQKSDYFSRGWKLTEEYFFSQAEVDEEFPPLPEGSFVVCWPVEEMGDGIVYVPAPEQLEDA